MREIGTKVLISFIFFVKLYRKREDYGKRIAFYKSIMDWLNTKTRVRICFYKDIDHDCGRDYLEVTMDIRHSQRSNKTKRVDRQFIVKRFIDLSYSDKTVANILDEMYQDGLSMMEQCK